MMTGQRRTHQQAAGWSQNLVTDGTNLATDFKKMVTQFGHRFQNLVTDCKQLVTDFKNLVTFVRTALVTRMRMDVLGAHHSSKCAGVAHRGSQLVKTRKYVVGGKGGYHPVVLEGACVMCGAGHE